ncbi:citrate lyase subunit beta/citryl-CoA lyase [Amorphus suaedae]
MRSWLFVPGDSERKLARALIAGADALILDLEDSVAPEAKDAARARVCAFLDSNCANLRDSCVFVRVRDLRADGARADLEAVMRAAPDGIVLPKSVDGRDVARLDAMLTVCEAEHGLPDLATRIVAIATESAEALFGLASYRGASRRLAGLAWGGEDLSADLGSTATRDADGALTDPFRMARSLCLAGAVAAGVQPIDTVFTDFRDLDGLRREAEMAARDGFTGKLAIHPDQVPVINAAFTPSDAAVAEARRVVEAFAAAPGAGVVSLDGRMVDRPHLIRARRLLERARRAGLAID